MNTEIEESECPFTAEQVQPLTPEQREVLEAVAEYLSGSSLPEEEFHLAFNLLRTCRGCVPPEEAGEDLLNRIRSKFGAVYEVGMELAEAELNQKNRTDFSFCLVMDPRYEDATHIVILDYNKPVCYLHESIKAWHLGFDTLAGLADAVLQVKKQLVEKVSKATEIFIVIEGGVVHEMVNLPSNLTVTVIDYDVDGVGLERREISPLDGEVCVITKW